MNPDKVDHPQNLRRAMILSAFWLLCALALIMFDRPPRAVQGNASLSLFSADRAVMHLRNISRAPHPINSAEHDRVRDYILNALRDLGFTPEVQRSAIIGRDGTPGTLQNILCRLQGSSKGRAVLLVAHYDSVAAGPGASDDGAAVAAFLEGARVLKSRAPLKRDVIFLFSDGEEKGLLGARAFVENHPWAHGVAFVLNFEARGNSGPSMMFETSSENGWLISNFGRAASHPVANSLSYEIYKRMPNDTDFTVFRRAGYSGLNFAFINGLAYYHTSADTVENLDRGSLQHHGDYLVDVATQLGNAMSEDPRTGNLVYFDVFGKVLVRYGSGASFLFLGLAIVLVLMVFYSGLRNKSLKVSSAAAGAAATVFGVIVVILAAWATSWVASALRLPGIAGRIIYAQGWYVAAFCLIGIACGAVFFLAVIRRIGAANFAAGCLLVWSGMAIGATIYLPGASYLVLWPFLFIALGWTMLLANNRVSDAARIFVFALSGLPAIVLIIPMAHKIFFAFAVGSTRIASSLVGLCVSLLIAPIAAELSHRWRLYDKNDSAALNKSELNSISSENTPVVL